MMQILSLIVAGGLLVAGFSTLGIAAFLLRDDLHTRRRENEAGIRMWDSE